MVDDDALNDAEWRTEVETRLAALEQAVTDSASVVRTGRLEVGGPGGVQIVGEVRSGTAELRVQCGDDSSDTRSAVVLYAHPSDAPEGPGPGVGLQLWAEGDAIGELDVLPDAAGRWHPSFHLSSEG